jgi:alpha-galactosidase
MSIAPLRAGLPTFQQTGNLLLMSNANVQVQYNLSTGTADFLWQNIRRITAFYSGVGLSSGYVKGLSFSNRTWAVVSSNQVAVTAVAAGLPAMKQYFILDQDNSFLTRVEMNGAGASANWMGPVVVDTPGGVDVGSYNDNRALFAPFDNDGFVRYNAEKMNGSDVGNEVGAFYDNTTRNGLVAGSVTHDTWKTGIYWSGSNNKLDKLNVFGGVTNHWTWDVMAHGWLTGSSISSPTVFVGFGNDWRATLEAFADENRLFAPKLGWTNGVPFGWNSWGYYQTHINYASAIAVSDSIHTNLQPYGFNNSGSIYINLDSYWDNMSDFQLLSFSSHCHANGQKAGIYWSPFVWWGSSVSASNSMVEGSSGYFYSDVLLRDGRGNYQTNDGALAMDPTHPGTKQRIDYYINRFINNGFDYLKLDFLSHGAHEGIHYDPTVATGIQAYNQGMQYVLNDLGGRMFVSESIAPLFPYQYGHSRRIACDAGTSQISNTEYTMNSVSYGWWLDRLYAFNDPDIMDFGTGPDINENQSRVISGAITGVFLDGDSLTNAASIGAAQRCLTNAAINSVARVGQTFRLLEGNTGSSASDMFVRQDGSSWCVAVFNYSSSPTNKTVDLSRAGLPAGPWFVTNLWDGTFSTNTGILSVSLNAKQAKLFKLIPLLLPPVIGSISVSRTNLIRHGSGGSPNGTYRVLAAATLALSRPSWTQVGTGSFDAGGAFVFTLTNTPNLTQRFFLLQVP